ncbi:MAG: peptidoglycan DD-metalloendopeptidase family protein [Vicinamibacterales bacterium]
MSDLAGIIERARASAQAASGEAPAPGSDRYELQRVAQQFEAMLLTQMLREMRKAGEWKGDDEGEQGLSLGGDKFTEAIDAELGLHLAKNSGLGLTSQLMQAFERLTGGIAPSASVVPAALAPAPVGPVPVAPAATTPEDASAVALPSKVTSGFGWRSDPFTGQAKFHKGVDLRAAYGQDIPAAAPGTVVFSGEQRGYGTTVVIEHADGSRSRYAHLSAATVSEGTDVAAGQPVGRAGSSGRATGTHLHFEVTSPEGEPISPSRWMQGRATANEA